jgi:hypothetical protein
MFFFIFFLFMYLQQIPTQDLIVNITGTTPLKDLRLSLSKLFFLLLLSSFVLLHRVSFLQIQINNNSDVASMVPHHHLLRRLMPAVFGGGISIFGIFRCASATLLWCIWLVVHVVRCSNSHFCCGDGFGGWKLVVNGERLCFVAWETGGEWRSYGFETGVVAAAIGML